MRRIAIIGAGSMGSGIAQVAAMSGHNVVLFDAFPQAIQRANESIFSSLHKLIEKGKLTKEDANIAHDRIEYAQNLAHISECDLVIEAIIEDQAEKERLFSQIESLLRNDTVIATNTSSLSVTGLAKNLIIPGRFIGIHFFNPPVMMKLVEIIPALQTSASVIQSVTELITSWGKETVQAKDTPGFIVNRVARPFYSEALRIAEEQIGTPEEIDGAMKEAGFRMGPFELMDFIGNDINEAVTRSVWTSMHYDPRYKPSSLQVNLVRAGWLGKKSGKGFYDYTEERKTNAISNGDNAELIRDRILTMLINEAADAYYYGIASKEDIDKAMVLGVNYPKGLMRWADEIGIEECVNRMDNLHHFYKEERYRCSPCLRKMSLSKQNFY